MNVLKNKKTVIEITDENSPLRDAYAFKNEYSKKYSIDLLKEVKKSLQSKIDLIDEMISIHPDEDDDLHFLDF